MALHSGDTGIHNSPVNISDTKPLIPLNINVIAYLAQYCIYICMYNVEMP